MQPVGVVAGRHHQCRSGVGSDAEDIEELRNGAHEERLDPGVELGELAVERFDAMRQ
jgi:hypothetical protein